MKAASARAAGSAVQPRPGALRLMSDERLARWAARGSEAAFAVIFERHHQALHRYCHSIVGNGHDAADALQSTMLKALRALPGETREIALKPWLYRIAHNESISLLRARRCDGDLEAAAHVGDAAADGIVESRERLRCLAGDLQELSDQQRGALLMRELGGLAFAEIADALGVAVTAARQSAYEARCALHELEAGRAMACDLVRRALSDGDRRSLRGMRLRSHLRACAECRDFEAALHRRPAQLAAFAPPLPVADAASILHGLLGGGGGHGSGGGLLAGLGTGAKGAGGTTLATKLATVVVVGSTVAGGTAVAVPALRTTPDRAAGPAAAAASRHRVPLSSGALVTTRSPKAGLARAAESRRPTASRAAAAVRGAARGVTPGRAAPAAAEGPARRAPARAAGSRRTKAVQAARPDRRRARDGVPAPPTTRKPPPRPTAPPASATPVAAATPAITTAAASAGAAPVTVPGAVPDPAGGVTGGVGTALSPR